MPAGHGVAEGPCHAFFRDTEQFCTVLRRRVSEAGNGSKEQFPASVTRRPNLAFLRSPFWASAPRTQAKQCVDFTRNWACSDRSIVWGRPAATDLFCQHQIA